MIETKNPFIPDYRRSLSEPENSEVRILLRRQENYSQEQEKEVAPINKNLPPDHLTATYWG